MRDRPITSLPDPATEPGAAARFDVAWSIRAFTPADRPALQRMYATFEPKRAAQGLPPEEPHRLTAWLDHVLGHGTHLLAFAADDVVGHVMLVPLETRTVELANFVDLRWRNRGLGTALNIAAIQAARQTGAERVWLCVDPSNRAAIRSYTRAGFRPAAGRPWAPEIEMVHDLGTGPPSPAGAGPHGNSRGA